MIVTGAAVLKLSRLIREPDTTTVSSFCGSTAFWVWGASTAGLVLGASFSAGVVCAPAVCKKIIAKAAKAMGFRIGLEICAMFWYFRFLVKIKSTGYICIANLWNGVKQEAKNVPQFS